MRQMTVLIIVSALILVQGGCVKYWYREGTTFDECKDAHAKCLEELSKRTDFSNAGYEYKYVNECMRAKGYRQVYAGKLPLDVKRHGPESSLDWREKGIAGTLPEP
ncbi:MAG: hypothetical protein LLF76_10235 [Planctomycetaceae bacterium]|nr:hypothetical protein [Planctomycetaceae bacterium]